MLRDICTCDVSLTDNLALADWNGVILGVLSHGQSTATHLASLITRAPEFAMAQAVRGLASLMLGRSEMVAVAAEASATAQSLLRLGGATRRERLWCAALDAWLNGYPTRSIAHLEAALRLDPADTLSMKMSHGIRFILGDSRGMLQSVQAVLPAQGEDHPLHGYILGCHAFALEETGSYALAERTGRRGLDFAGDDAWGLHAVTHVLDMTRQTQRGIALIDDNRAAWSHCNNFRFHVWWHKALLHLDHGDVAQVLALYDQKIRDEKTDDYRDISNASSLLMRLELDGVDTGDRWEELADLAEARSADGCLVFADLHYLLALTGDNRTDAALRLTARIAKDAERDGDMARVMDCPGTATARGLTAFAAGQYDTAFANLCTAQPHFAAMGGSHAQRDVFERLTIEAAIRAGQWKSAEKLLQVRTHLRDGVRDAFAEARISHIRTAREVGNAHAAE